MYILVLVQCASAIRKEAIRHADRDSANVSYVVLETLSHTLSPDVPTISSLVLKDDFLPRPCEDFCDNPCDDLFMCCFEL